MFLRLIFAIGFFMAAVPSIMADTVAPDVLAFDEFSRKVLSYYPKLKAAHSDVDVALAREMQARAGFWPSLDVSAGYKVTNDPVDVFSTLLHQERFTSSDFDLKRLNTPDRHQGFSAGVHLDMPLFDAMQTINRARAAKESVRAAVSDEAFTRMEAFVIAQDAYGNALTLQKLLAAVEEVYTSAGDDLRNAGDLKDRGMVLGADYYAARVMFGDLARMKNELARQKKAMMALLNILMGEGMDRDWVLAASLKEPVGLRRDAQAWVDSALSRREDLRALDSRLKTLGLEQDRARAGALPRFSVFADAANARNTLAADGGNDFTVGLKGSMPLFDPGRKGRVEEARAHKERLEHEIRMLKDSVRRDISGEVARQEACHDNVSVFKRMSEDAAQAVAFTAPLYNEGRRSIKDLIEARRAYLQATQAYDKAVAGLWLSQGRLLFMAGALDEEQMKQLLQGAGL